MPQNLKHILQNIPIKQTIGNIDIAIHEIVFDSRKATVDTVFVAVRGTLVDGHRYIQEVIAAGCKAIICEVLPNNVPTNIAFIQVINSAKTLGLMAANFYDNPSKKLHLVGITGTNGKTTTATLLYRLCRSMGYPAGLLSTIENRINDTIIPATHTTPDAVTLHRLLHDMVERGCQYAFMEVSSHALVQQRVSGVVFAGGVFTNITHDHLDYHKTFTEYIKAKKLLFDNLPKGSFALVNKDDKRGMVMLQNTVAQKRTYALRTMANYKAKIIENSLNGLQLDLCDYEYHGRLIGEFNAYNTLAVYATAMELGLPSTEVLAALSNLNSADGRFETLKNNAKNIIGIVDYAHTPDALENVLRTIDNLKAGMEKIITVIGCGGDRDKTKRPIMAKIACDYSTTVVLTSDNPRTEDPNTILAEMQAGIPANATQKVLIIENREQAIKTACQIGAQNAIILVAGKGHEPYQEINNIKYPFDDKAILFKLIIDNG